MADTSIRGVVVVWDSEGAPKPAKPVRNLEDELVGPLVINGRTSKARAGKDDFVCKHCGEGTNDVDSSCHRPSCIAMRGVR